MLVKVTGQSQYRAWSDGLVPPVERVGPALWSVPVPIPLAPLRYVNVYALGLDDGVALVDAGWDTEEAWTALVDGLGVAGYVIEDVRAVLVTHIHPDHYGLAARVREASGAWIGLHAGDARLLRERYTETGDLLRQMRAQLTHHGVPAGQVDSLSDASMGVRSLVGPSEPDVALEDGEPVPLPGWRLTGVWTPGHSPGHLCFHAPERRLLFSGDHVLPRISPNVTVHAQQRPNPLGDFLESLGKVRALEVDEVLPAHEYRFEGLPDRVDNLMEHHRGRLDELAGLVASDPGLPGWELARRLTWSRPWDEIKPHPRRIALGETLAHLTMLAAGGRVTTSDDGTVRWHPSP